MVVEMGMDDDAGMVVDAGAEEEIGDESEEAMFGEMAARL